MNKLERRDVLKIGALAAAGMGFPAILRAQAKEIVILGLWDQTGAFADVGPLNDRGMKMALEEREMKILGRPIKYITRDGGTQAGTSTRRTEEAVDAEGAKFVIGPGPRASRSPCPRWPSARKSCTCFPAARRTSPAAAATAIPSSGRRAPIPPPR